MHGSQNIKIILMWFNLSKTLRSCPVYKCGFFNFISWKKKIDLFNNSLLKNYTNKARIFNLLPLKFKAKKTVPLTTNFYLFS